MSKIGKRPIEIIAGAEATLSESVLEVKGPKGKLSLNVHPDSKLEINEKEIIVSKAQGRENSSTAAAVWGLTRSLVNNMIIGVTQGYEKKLELQGVGYRMAVAGKKITMALGFSHPVEVIVPDNLDAKIEENNVLTISGIDKQAVGQFAAEVRKLKPVEPYKGKGFRYQGEKVRRKAGKKAGTAK
jgi:large subunit ribosomal protein L6